MEKKEQEIKKEIKHEAYEPCLTPQSKHE